jgi:chemotaxis protein CheC
MLELNDLEHDALIEVFNIGTGQAAAMLSQMLGDHIELSVPAVCFVSRLTAASELTADAGKRICGVSQRFQGAFNADAILIFPENKSLEIVRLLVGDDIPLDELTAMEQEALSEIGNIILNALVGTLANLLGWEFSCSLPMYHFGTSGEILHTEVKSETDLVMLLHIGLRLERHQINGYVAFLLDLSSIQGLREGISRFLGGTTG